MIIDNDSVYADNEAANILWFLCAVVYTESTCPIAVYDAEHWLAIGGMAVNISLVQQTLGLVNHGYWLRVGVMFDDDMPAQGAGSGVPPNTGTATALLSPRFDLKLKAKLKLLFSYSPSGSC